MNSLIIQSSGVDHGISEQESYSDDTDEYINHLENSCKFQVKNDLIEIAIDSIINEENKVNIAENLDIVKCFVSAAPKNFFSKLVKGEKLKFFEILLNLGDDFLDCVMFIFEKISHVSEYHPSDLLLTRIDHILNNVNDERVVLLCYKILHNFLRFDINKRNILSYYFNGFSLCKILTKPVLKEYYELMIFFFKSPDANDIDMLNGILVHIIGFFFPCKSFFGLLVTSNKWSEKSREFSIITGKKLVFDLYKESSRAKKDKMLEFIGSCAFSIDKNVVDFLHEIILNEEDPYAAFDALKNYNDEYLYSIFLSEEFLSFIISANYKKKCYYVAFLSSVIDIKFSDLYYSGSMFILIHDIIEMDDHIVETFIGKLFSHYMSKSEKTIRHIIEALIKHKVLEVIEKKFPRQLDKLVKFH